MDLESNFLLFSIYFILFSTEIYLKKTKNLHNYQKNLDSIDTKMKP